MSEKKHTSLVLLQNAHHDTQRLIYCVVARPLTSCLFLATIREPPPPVKPAQLTQQVSGVGGITASLHLAVRCGLAGAAGHNVSHARPEPANL